MIIKSVWKLKKTPPDSEIKCLHDSVPSHSSTRTDSHQKLMPFRDHRPACSNLYATTPIMNNDQKGCKTQQGVIYCPSPCVNCIPWYVIVDRGAAVEEHNDSNNGGRDEHLRVYSYPGKIKANLLPKVLPVEKYLLLIHNQWIYPLKEKACD